MIFWRLAVAKLEADTKRGSARAEWGSQRSHRAKCCKGAYRSNVLADDFGGPVRSRTVHPENKNDRSRRSLRPAKEAGHYERLYTFPQ